MNLQHLFGAECEAHWQISKMRAVTPLGKLLLGAYLPSYNFHLFGTTLSLYEE